MASYNEVLLMGNLTRDPELRSTASGAMLCKFGLAVNRKFKSGDEWKEEVCFVDITVWGNQAENCAQYLEKGRPVFLSGRLQLNQWETDAGEKRSKLEVVANTVQFLGSAQGGGQGGGHETPPDNSRAGHNDIPF
jgi:single-strand DNA-binding protein